MAGAASVTATATERRLEFDVDLDGRPIGTHRYTVTGDPGSTAVVESEARFDVRVLGFSAYRYRHLATGRWTDGCLATLEATTSDNGRELHVTGAMQDGRFVLERPAPSGTQAACLTDYAYWDRDRLLRQTVLLNPQTGTLDAVSFEPLGTEALAAKGGTVSAEHYRLHAARFVIDLWYAPDGTWMRLVTTTETGRHLVYRRRGGSVQG